MNILKLSTTLVFLFLLGLPGIIKAQFYTIKPANDGIPGIDFKTDFIKQKKIKKICLSFFVKPGRSRIERKNQNTEYNIDSLGRISSQASNEELIKIGLDSTTTWFVYDSLNQVKIKRIKDSNGYNAYYYTRDSAGMLTKQVYCKESNISENKNIFKLGKQEVLSLETIEYITLSNRQTKKIFYNDLGKKYKEAILYYDSLGRNTEENAHYTATSINVNYKYKYDDSSRIVEKLYYSDATGDYTEKLQYVYGEKGNIKEEIFYRNDVLVYNKFYFYNTQNNLPESELIKHAASQETFEISKFEYEYYQ